MRASLGKISISRLLAVFAAMTISFLFAVTSAARSEGPAAALAPVAEGSAAAEEVQVPAPVTTSAPVADGSPEVTEPTAAPDSASVIAAAQRSASQVVNEVDHASEAVIEGASTVDSAAPPAGNLDPRPIVHEAVTRHPAVKQLSETEVPGPGSSSSSKQGALTAVDAQAPASEVAASGPGPEALKKRTPSFPESPPAGRPTRQPIAVGPELLFDQISEGRDAAPRLPASADPIDLPTTVAAAASSIHSSPSPVPGHPATRTPLDSPQPPLGSSGEAAPAAGGSSFVPLAALLALLALVTAAILRRFREVPDLPAPALFVCALERPG